MIWRLMDGDVEAFRGTYAACLDYAEQRAWLARHFHADGTEMAPRWRTRGIGLVPCVTGAAEPAPYELARVPVFATALLAVTGFGAAAFASVAHAAPRSPLPDDTSTLVTGILLGALLCATLVALALGDLWLERRRAARRDGREDRS